jgi:type IV pilus assembly protein PilE
MLKPPRRSPDLRGRQTNGSAGPINGGKAPAALRVGSQNHDMVHIGLPTRRRASGFTLIELMIVVAIVAILGAVVFPSFLDSMRKSRRTEAFSAIAAVQQAQERWRGNNPAYSSSLSDLGIPSSTSSPRGYYTLSVATESASATTEYTVSAVAVSGTSQANDGNCTRLAARVSGAQIRYASCSACSTFTFAESDACWNR